MTKLFNNKALDAFKKLGTVAIITATTLMLAMFFTACKQTSGGGKPKHEVTFSVEGGNGRLYAKVDGMAETDKSPITVEEGKTVTFTAKANDGYRVKGWTLDGKPVAEAGTKTEWKHTVKKPANIKVSFLAGNATYTVKHYQEKAEGGYPAEPEESENLTGTVGENATYTAKTYEGFTYNSALTKINGTVKTSGTIAADNSTVVELFYERNTVSLTFHLAGGNIEGKTDDIVKTGKYGTAFTAPVPVKENAIFKGWKPDIPTPLLFPSSNAEYTAEWTPLYTIYFGVDGANGTLKAIVSDKEITSGGEVEEGKEVTFTATANDGYEVKEWKVNGKPIAEAGTKMEYKHTVTKPATITVNFEFIPKAILTLESGKNTVKVKAKTSDGKPITVEGCNEPTLASDLETELHATGTTITLKGYITELYCIGINKGYLVFDAQLLALDVQELTALQKLNCMGNNLPELNVQGLTSLQVLSCYSNQLTELNVQGLTSLQTLHCYYNQLPELNVQGLTALQVLACPYNQLTELNVQGLTALKELYCYNNQLTSLDVQGLTALKVFDCYSNQLTDLDVQGLTSLIRLECYYNQLTELNVQGLNALRYLRCYGNKLDATAITELLKALPACESGDNAFARLYIERTGVPEGNCKDYTQPEDLKKAFDEAKKRNWKLQKRDANVGYWEDI